VALAWVLRNQNVSSAIVGASRPEQIFENAKALDVMLEDDFVEALENALEPTTLFDPAFTFSPASRNEM
jgi:aryl-alcohol dehydrogenase-like predicted oxidoreductase